jgi:threonine/homoserine/homoserine lactone efflux protein
MGFCIAAPVGPIGLLCIRRSIADGRLAGFISGLGAASADALYGAIAALGLSAITDLLLSYRVVVQLLGSLFLLYMGVSLMRAKTPTANSPGSGHAPNLGAAYASTLLLTLANPATILAFVGIFAGLGIGVDTASTPSALTLIGGVFLGSAVWWLILSTGANWLGGKLAAHRFHVINIVSGSLIIAFGAWHLIALLRFR